MPGDMTKNNGEFIIGQKTLMRGSAKHPRRDLWFARFWRDSTQRVLQSIRRCVGQQSMLLEQSSDRIHALPAATDNPTLTSRCPARRTFRFARLVNQRGVEATNAGRDDLFVGTADINDPPSARRNAEINSENTPDSTLTHHAT